MTPAIITAALILLAVSARRIVRHHAVTTAEAMIQEYLERPLDMPWEKVSAHLLRHNILLSEIEPGLRARFVRFASACRVPGEEELFGEEAA